MRVIVSVLFVLVVSSGAALAQPGQVPPSDPAGPTVAPDPGPPPMGPPAEPYPAQPQPYPPQPYPYPGPPQPYPYPVQLTPEEHQLLSEGEITLGAHAGGVAANWLLGFGIGQAIQGRWSDTGWMFTLGEAAGITLIVAGIARSCLFCADTEQDNDDAGVLIVGGLLSYTVFHIWSIVDAATGPANHNRKVRALKQRIGLPMHASQRVLPYASSTRDGGGVAGLTLRF